MWPLSLNHPISAVKTLVFAPGYMALRKGTLLMLPETAIPLVELAIELGALVLLPISAAKVVVGVIVTVWAKLVDPKVRNNVIMNAEKLRTFPPIRVWGKLELR
jgi:hypothetical protein